MASLTAQPTDGQVLRSVGAVPTWKTQERVRASMTAVQAIPNNSATAVAFDGTDDFDTNTMHDPASNNTRVTFTTAGVYVVLGSGAWAANATGQRGVFIRLNGTTDLGREQGQATSAGSAYLQAMTVITAAAADYVELMAFQNSGGNLNFGGTGEENFLAAWRLT